MDLQNLNVFLKSRLFCSFNSEQIIYFLNYSLVCDTQIVEKNLILEIIQTNLLPWHRFSV